MITKKDIPLATIEISENKYKKKKSNIWINTISNCILRIENLHIKNEFDKFDSIHIDCETNSAFIIDNDKYPEIKSLDNLENFLVLLNQSIVNSYFQDNTKTLNYGIINKILNLIEKEKENNV